MAAAIYAKIFIPYLNIPGTVLGLRNIPQTLGQN